ARLALHRLDDYLTQPDVEPLDEHPLDEGGDTAIELQDGEFTWDGDDTGPALSGISLNVKKGDVVAIIGDVGSGKSSFVAALLGQIRQTGGGSKLKLYGKSSYVPQEAWLINVNLRENIIFGKDFEQERYDTVIKVCALERDITLLSHGDKTEIGERGSNLSGGQKQRVSLARAVYHKSDIVLMDDPLSAVDQNVGEHIFDQCIRGYLSDRTVIFVTHQLQYLHRCDNIVMLRNGKIACQGTFDELMSNEPSFSTLINTHVSNEDEDGTQHDDIDTESQSTADSSLTADETKPFERGARPRRHTLPLNTWVGDTPGTTSIRSKNRIASSQGQYNQLQRILSRASENDILNSTLREQSSLHFISHEADTFDTDFNRAVNKNELSIHSYTDISPYGNRRNSSGYTSVNKVPIRRNSTLSRIFSVGTNKELPEAEGSDDEDFVEEEEEEEKVGTLIGQDQSMDELGFADYAKYFKAGSGVLITILVIILFFIAHGIRIGSDYWLRLWVPNTLHSSDSLYLGVYGAFIVAFALAVLTRGLWFAHEATQKSEELHNRAFKSVMLAPMSFFETNSLGRILSAFSKCMFTVDDTLPDACFLLLQYFPLALGAFCIIAIVVRWQNAVAVICLLLIAIGFVWYGSPADSKLKQMEALSKPPVFQHISTTIEGLFSIRAYNVQKRFDYMNMAVLDKNHESLYAMLSIYRHHIHQVASVAGLALSNALQMLVFLQWTVRQMGEVQAQISTVGQLDYYGRRIVPEAPAEIPNTKPDSSWPQEGRIDFDHLVLKYRKDSPPVLKDVSFSIMPKEKVGIVGRTGSGKSTLLVGLLRIVEASEGSIRIDGIDISTLGLKDLRTKVGIIPQEPVLFVGTIRSNLDPFNRHEDDDMWRALDAVHLGDKIREMPLKLDSPVVEHGKNFSLGQRQLICIARSLVIGSKIIVLDEATASIDMVTDKLLQETIKKNFANCTVLTIAHRLNTIIESDKVLVMDGGVVAEFGEPYKLLQNPNGIFSELVSHAGEAASRKLAGIAKEAYDLRNDRRISAEEETKGS
ncbi:Multidrug resistance-associated protein 5, partial [Haplosporangium sp. Z 27]